MNDHDVIDAGVKEWEWRGGPVTPRILDAISEAGYVLVKLPEPDPQGCFPAGGGTRVMVTSYGKITNGYAIRENAEEARALAAALLAAAAQLEARS